MPCHPPKTNADKIWSYDEYYYGEKDEENRKNGAGLHHWTGAESLEWYKGRLLRDTMHGYGDYRWRYQDGNHAANTYEGRFYNNNMHGYGVMSYPNGRVFYGLFYNNARWGPGVMSHACLREDVGLWNGTQLARLSWRPSTPSVAIDLMSTPVGRNVVTPHRVLLSTNTEIIGEVNSALELLKQYGAEPLAAIDKWKKLYPANCTDTDSQLCHKEVFDRAYYKKQINTLYEVSTVPEKDASLGSKENLAEKETYYAWNNNKMTIHMMKHCYQHEKQRRRSGLKLADIMAGPRSSFKMPGKHELDCRTLLMASYLGHITNVAQLINEFDVNPNVTDMQGNSVLMYAACGDQPDTIHFLVEAGAEIDGYNDACCTPLGVTLLRFALAQWDVPPSGMLQALLPPPALSPPPGEENVLEWNIKRDLTTPVATVIHKAPSKILKPVIAKKVGSTNNITNGNGKKKSETNTKPEPQITEPRDSFSEEKRVYENINNEYMIRVNEAFSQPAAISSITYIFNVRDMIKDVELMTEEEHKKTQEKNPKKVASKVIKDTMRPSKEMMWQTIEKTDGVLDSKEQMKQDKLNIIMLTILQLLADGADPRKIRCPQPPLFIATVAGCPDLIDHLVHHGADINEVYPNALGYSTLDIAVAGAFTFDNLIVIRSLLENGAMANHRLPVKVQPALDSLEPVQDDGPTLLHAVLARKVENEPEEEIRRQILELLLQYGCNPIIRYKGQSAVDVAMSKNMDIFETFIKSPRTDLNAVINDSEQTILLKMFYLPFSKGIPLTERLQLLTNLMLFGADPLVKCHFGKEEYDNLFVYVRKVVTDLEMPRKPPSPTGNAKKTKSDTKTKKSEKEKLEKGKPEKGKPEKGKVKKDDKSVKSLMSSKSPGKVGDDLGDYKQALSLVVECARLLYIRWLQAKLMKELIEIVAKYKHRHWNMIIKEHNNKRCTGLWLSTIRCLEIWDILKTTKKKKYNDQRILKYVLCIVQYYYKMMNNILRSPIRQRKMFTMAMSAQEKAVIESEVGIFIHEHNLATMSTPNMVPAIRPYVTPELTVTGIEKFDVCFECVMPLKDAKILCGSCKLIAFCSFTCMKRNIGRPLCHPCSSYLKEKYFPTPEEIETEVDLV